MDAGQAGLACLERNQILGVVGRPPSLRRTLDRSLGAGTRTSHVSLVSLHHTSRDDDHTHSYRNQIALAARPCPAPRHVLPAPGRRAETELVKHHIGIGNLRFADYAADAEPEPAPDP